MQKIPWIRVVYLYLMTTIGLVVFIIGSVTLIQLGLKIFIFTQADNDIYSMNRPTSLYLEKETDQVEAIKSCESLTEADQTRIQAWLEDYEAWQVKEDSIDRKRASRERDAARSIAMILVGLPVFYYHWSVIKKDRKDNLNV
ncbi:MAG: hypothetical protein COU22_00050 [Candidatus Komeilibacteria bacterium CG10_big_fil_rev_8_21_14_0_10_41_13]|uniref:DUF5671 domain-containing protein n=1 Tax=Candidatus Komeilibacteria bacterium CG10_big_fil_rev_8_21_14_0_10_41_13 TaxID=1974476 RepID=A0A2M6WDE8_9BACT|nr:MAG: hypothetical protein COU22_00050 [Candidatus Komeilibacteria bacterium CG10_big_fil_rev_8_21_14_0_10_41_13]